MIEKKSSGIDFSLLLSLFRLLKQQHINIVHAHCEASFLYGGLASRLLGILCVGTYHRSELKYYQPNFKNRLFSRLLSHCVAISSERQSRMIEQLGIPKIKTTIIHGGIEPEEAHSELTPSQIKQKLELINNDKIIFSAGHLGIIKGHDDSIIAMGDILQKHPGAKLYIAGDGSTSDYERLTALIKQHQLEKNITLMGQIPNTMEWMNICDIFLLPSHEEGFGLVFLEAGLCSKPVVATEVGGIPDIIQEGKTGFLVTPQNSQKIAQQIILLLDDTTLASSMGEAGNERVKEQFALHSQIKKLESMYLTIV